MVSTGKFISFLSNFFTHHDLLAAYGQSLDQITQYHQPLTTHHSPLLTTTPPPPPPPSTTSPPPTPRRLPPSLPAVLVARLSRSSFPRACCFHRLAAEFNASLVVRLSPFCLVFRRLAKSISRSHASQFTHSPSSAFAQIFRSAVPPSCSLQIASLRRPPFLPANSAIRPASLFQLDSLRYQLRHTPLLLFRSQNLQLASI